jgi:hypothetical protein
MRAIRVAVSENHLARRQLSDETKADFQENSCVSSMTDEDD